jgi:hypothetical protein
MDYIENEDNVDTSTNIRCENISRNLAKCVGMNVPGFSRDNSSKEWNPPDKHGLRNSDPVIPSYYLTGKDLKGNIFNVDYLFTIQDDIKNYRPLSIYQKQYLTRLPTEQLISLILLYDEVCNITIQNILMED